jgi:hypothetical protein
LVKTVKNPPAFLDRWKSEHGTFIGSVAYAKKTRLLSRPYQRSDVKMRKGWFSAAIKDLYGSKKIFG